MEEGDSGNINFVPLFQFGGLEIVQIRTHKRKLEKSPEQEELKNPKELKQEVDEELDEKALSDEIPYPPVIALTSPLTNLYTVLQAQTSGTLRNAQARRTPLSTPPSPHQLVAETIEALSEFLLKTNAGVPFLYDRHGVRNVHFASFGNESVINKNINQLPERHLGRDLFDALMTRARFEDTTDPERFEAWNQQIRQYDLEDGNPQLQLKLKAIDERAHPKILDQIFRSYSRLALTTDRQAKRVVALMFLYGIGTSQSLKEAREEAKSLRSFQMALDPTTRGIDTDNPPLTYLYSDQNRDDLDSKIAYYEMREALQLNQRRDFLNTAKPFELTEPYQLELIAGLLTSPYLPPKSGTLEHCLMGIVVTEKMEEVYQAHQTAVHMRYGNTGPKLKAMHALIGSIAHSLFEKSTPYTYPSHRNVFYDYSISPRILDERTPASDYYNEWFRHYAELQADLGNGKELYAIYLRMVKLGDTSSDPTVNTRRKQMRYNALVRSAKTRPFN